MYHSTDKRQEFWGVTEINRGVIEIKNLISITLSGQMKTGGE